MICDLSNTPVTDALENRLVQLSLDLSHQKVWRRKLEVELKATNKGIERLRIELNSLQAKYDLALKMLIELGKPDPTNNASF